MQTIFFSGAGGSGMSALAGFDRLRGLDVRGSDRAFDLDAHAEPADMLRSLGIEIFPQDGSGIDGSVDLLVASTAVEADTPDIARARGLGIPIVTRPEHLAGIVAAHKSIAVAGTSGKSTTSALLAYVMWRLGMRPNFLGGAALGQFAPLSGIGNVLVGGSPLLVAEACESDGSIVQYRPAHSIVLNLDLDHHAVDETARMFLTLREHTAGTFAVNADDENLARHGLAEGAVTFSIESPSPYRAESVEPGPRGSTWKVRGVTFELRHPGLYNVLNATAAIALLHETFSVPLDAIADPLRDFQGIERRFAVALDDSDRLVIDDYAHNPHKIAAFMRAARQLRPAICFVFQPHGFGPTRLMREGYVETFASHLRSTDRLILLPIYYAGGTVAQDISSEDLAREIAARGASAAVCRDREDIIRSADGLRAFAIMGARDRSLSALARQIAARL